MGDLQAALGDAFGAFEGDVLGRFDPDPGADGGALHGDSVAPRGSKPYDLFHLDSANATGDLAGLFTHFGRDVVGGNKDKIGLGSPCLDPAFRTP